MCGAHDSVRHCEEERPVTECLGDAQRHDEQARGGGEHHDADRALLGLDHARQPGEPDPCPPEHREHQHRPAQAFPRRLVLHERGALGEPEHEDEVEEELERLDKLAFTQLGGDPGNMRP